MAKRVQILENRETLTLNQRGEPIRVRKVSFAVGNHGPFDYEVPVEEWDIARFREYVADKVKEIEEMEALSV